MSVATGNLFVYGSLLSGFHHPAYRYISDHFQFLGAGRVRGLLFDMGDYPAALPCAEDRFIIGELYALKNPDEFSWVMAQLDDYEGVDGEEGAPPLYRRDRVTVLLDHGSVQSWIYWYCGDTTGKPEILSGDVLAYRKSKNR